MCFVAITVSAQATVALHDAAIARLAKEMLNCVGPPEDLERAAFVILGKDGVPKLLHWPRLQRFREAQWLGGLPADVVAVIHTHPYKRPLPSMQDAAEARRLALPFYIVSRGALSVVSADGSVRRAASVPWVSRPGRKKSVGVRLDWYDYALRLT